MKVKTTHCRHGHERTPENIYVAPKTGVVGCRICGFNAIKFREHIQDRIKELE